MSCHLPVVRFIWFKSFQCFESAELEGELPWLVDLLNILITWKTCRLEWQNLKFFVLLYILVVLYGCETWSLTLREEKILRVFQNKVLRRIFGPRSDEVTGEWRRLHNEEVNVLYCSPNIVRVIKWRRMRWAGHVARMGEERGMNRVLVGKPEWSRPMGRPRRRWVDNIRMDLREEGGV